MGGAGVAPAPRDEATAMRVAVGITGGLARRLIGASALLALLVGAGFVVLVLAVGDLRGAERRLNHAQRVLTAANTLERLLLDLETGERGFILTRQERFLQPWSQARRNFPRRANGLRELVAGHQGEEQLARQIERAGRSYIDDYSVPLVQAARRGDPSARSIAATEAGRRRVRTLRTLFDRLISAEGVAAARADTRVTAAAHRAVAAVVAASVGSIVLIVLYASYLARAIARPVRRAATMAGRLAGGDLTARMPETGVGEIGELERAFNVMASSLERSRDELEALAAEQAALRRVATFVAEGAPPGTIFTSVAEEVGRLLAADLTSIGRFEADRTVTGIAEWTRTGTHVTPIDFDLRQWDVTRLVFDTGRPARTDGSATAPVTPRGARIRSSVGAPISVAGRLWGAAVAASTGDRQLPPDAEERLTKFAGLVATAIANADARAELTASRARVVATADETRRRIERDLHDGAQQRLVSLALRLRAAQADVPPDLVELTAELDGIATGLGAALDELREYAHGIHPAILAEGGLGPALKTLARRSPLPVDLDVNTSGRLPDGIEAGAYYVVAEAMTNAAKHAHASTVAVAVDAGDAVLRIVIRDDGVGGASFSGGSGLVGLKDRVEALGGRIGLHSEPGAGTTVSVELPTPPNTNNSN